MNQQIPNSNTPRFKHHVGFAAVSNSVIHDPNLSLKAKGLFALIQSYITNDNLIVTKAFLQERCTEGEAAFENAWKELKNAGYLLQEKCKGEHGKFLYFYDLVNELPFSTKNSHTPKNHPVENHTVEVHPLENYPGGNPPHGKQGSYIKLNTKTNHKNQSINPIISDTPDTTTGIEDLQYQTECEIDREKSIPYHYFDKPEKLSIAIKYMTDYENTARTYFDHDEKKYNIFQMMITCLTEMASESRPMKYNGSQVQSGIKVIEKINDCIKSNSFSSDSVYASLCSFIEHTIEDFEKATNTTEIRDIHSYMKAVIWTSLISHKVKFDAFFNRTQNEFYSREQ